MRPGRKQSGHLPRGLRNKCGTCPVNGKGKAVPSASEDDGRLRTAPERDRITAKQHFGTRSGYAAADFTKKRRRYDTGGMERDKKPGSGI